MSETGSNLVGKWRAREIRRGSRASVLYWLGGAEESEGWNGVAKVMKTSFSEAKVLIKCVLYQQKL